MTIEELVNEILDEYKIELENDPDYSEDILKVKIKNAIREVRFRRNYSATSYNESKIIDELHDNYFSVIGAIALFDYNHVGAEGESDHSEGGDRRQWHDREKLFYGVHPFVSVL